MSCRCVLWKGKNTVANSQNLEDMKLPELKELAKQMGLRGTSTMRKPELLATLQAARSGGAAPEGVTVRAPKKTTKTAKSRTTKTVKNEDAPAQDDIQSVAQDAPVVTADDASKNDQSAQSAVQDAPAVADNVESSSVSLAGIEFPDVAPKARRARRNDEGEDRAARRDRKTNAASDTPLIDTAHLLDTLDLGKATEDSDRARGRRHTIDENGDEIIVANVRRRRRPSEEKETQEEVVRDLDDILATLPSQDNAQRNAGDDRRDRGDRARDRRDDRGERRDRSDARDDHADRRGRRLRGRNRDFDGHNDRRDDERNVRDLRFDDRGDRAERAGRGEQNDLVPVAGIVDVLDSYAFVRTSGYLPGPNDVYVSMGQVKKYGLRKGDAVHGAIRAPREGDRRNQRQKFVPLQSIDSINGMTVEQAMSRPQFSKLTPLYPQERLRQETTPNKLTGRIMDIVSPIGKGQRGLIVSPPKAGKTITLQNIANSITANNPEVHLMVVLVDERPEEVTDMERTVQGEVISSTFDRPASDHTTVAELAIERAKRLVELGQDVVVLLDSMTRLARAYNIAAPASGRILSGGVDAQALYPPKKFFGAARNIENGGSLTIIASALVETGSKMDEVIFEEFKGTGNMELRLSRELADKRLFPAIDINASGTRREELITAPQELPVVYRLRRLLGGMEPEQAYQTLVPRLKKTATNRDFLAAIVQQTGGGSANGN